MLWLWIMNKKLSDYRGNPKTTKGWTPEMKFYEFAKIRVPKLLKAMRSVRNLATVYNPATGVGYTYKPEQRKKVIRDIREGWRECIGAWESAGKKTKKSKKDKEVDYWETE